MYKNIIKIILVNLVLLGLFDLLFGLLFPVPKYLNKKNYDWGLYHSNYRNYFDPIKKGDETLFGIDYESVKYDLQKVPDNSFTGTKVIAIGDSFTEGQGVRVTDTYSNWLSRLSNDDTRGLNLGKGGDDILKIYFRFKNAKINFKPDYVIYGYCINDIINFSNKLSLRSKIKLKNPSELGGDVPYKWDLINLRTNVINQSGSELVSYLSKISNIFNYFNLELEKKETSRKTIEYYQKTHNPEYNKSGLAHLKTYLLKMQKHAQSLGAEFVLMIFPILFWDEDVYELDSVHEQLIKIAKELDIKYIDLKPTFLKHPAKDLWVHPVDQHPNDLAHKITAREILKFIHKQK